MDMITMLLIAVVVLLAVLVGLIALRDKDHAREVFEALFEALAEDEQMRDYIREKRDEIVERLSVEAEEYFEEQYENLKRRF